MGAVQFTDQTNEPLLNNLLTCATKEAPLTALSSVPSVSRNDGVALRLPHANAISTIVVSFRAQLAPAVDILQELLQKTVSFMKNRLRPDPILFPQQ